MKKYLCIYCQQINFGDLEEDQLYVEDYLFVEHLQQCHGLESRSLEAALDSLKTIGLFSEIEVPDIKK